MEICFTKGDLVFDRQTKEVGLLYDRYNLVDNARPVWAWKILWCGANVTRWSRHSFWTEQGLTNMVIDGVMTLYKFEKEV